MTSPSVERRSTERLDVSDAGIGHRFGHFRHSMVRGMAFAMALTVFFYAANSIDPGQSSAESDLPKQLPINHTQPAIPASSGSLGTLTSLGYIVEIHASAEGPRYTVRDSDGVVLGEMLEAYQIDQIIPGLEIEGMFAEPLMLAEPRPSYPD